MDGVLDRRGGWYWCIVELVPERIECRRTVRTLKRDVPVSLVPGKRRGQQGAAPCCSEFEEQQHRVAVAIGGTEQDVRVEKQAQVRCLDLTGRAP